MTDNAMTKTSLSVNTYIMFLRNLKYNKFDKLTTTCRKANDHNIEHVYFEDFQ